MLKLAIALLLLTTSVAFGGRLETVNEAIDAEGNDELVIDCEIGAANLVINSKDMAEAALVDITYDTRKFDYEVDFHTRGGKGYLYLEGSTRRNQSIHRIDNDWELTLSTRYPAELDMEIGACEAEIDFGGIPLSSINLEIGAVEGTIDFSTVNPERMEEFDIDIGASDVSFANLGNANFETLNLDCGAASVELDFRGTYTGTSEVSIDVGMGSADVILPEGVSIRVEADDDDWFSSIDFHGGGIEEVDDGVFETPDYRRGNARLLIDVDVGMGSVDFYFK
jgi:hypothetical protein